MIFVSTTGQLPRGYFGRLFGLLADATAAVVAEAVTARSTRLPRTTWQAGAASRDAGSAVGEQSESPTAVNGGLTVVLHAVGAGCRHAFLIARGRIGLADSARTIGVDVAGYEVLAGATDRAAAVDG